MKKFTKSKTMGKILDNKFVKRVMIPVGNKVIKMAKAPLKMVSNARKIESINARAKDNYYRENAPVGAYEGTNTGAVKFPSNVKRR